MTTDIHKATAEPAPEPYEPVILGPGDTLVLVTKERIASDVLARIVAKVPEIAQGRVLVVDGEAFETHVIRGEL